MADERAERRLSAILAADVVGYSRLVEADEGATLAAFKGHLDDLIAPTIADNRGRVVKTMGDGVLAEFASAVDAVLCASAIQDGMAARNAGVPEDRRLVFRIGINVGDIVIDGDDIQGDGVNVAARMEGLAEPGGICISSTVHDHVHGKLEIGFEDLGDQQVKNLARAVRAWRVVGHDGAVAAVRKPGWRRPVIAAAVTVVVVAAAGIGWWQPWAPDVEPASIAEMAFPLPDKPSIAVLPFANISGEAEQEYFADGLTEDIITNLASFPNLFVIARNSTARFKGKPVDIRDVAHDLGVRYVLEGSVRRAGNTLRVTAQLIDALGGNHIWAEKYDRELADVFALQDEITGEIGARLVSKLAAAEFKRRARKGTRNAEAYDLFLRGWKFAGGFNPRANARAIRFFEQAVEKDPEFARAYAFLAFLRRNNVLLRWAEGPKDTYAHAVGLARKAIALDPRDGLAYRMLSRVLTSQGKHDKALDAAEHAIALSPSDPDAMIQLAFSHAFAGSGEDAVGHAEAALRLNPRAPWFYAHFAGLAYYAATRYDEAVAAFERARRLNPRTAVPISFAAASYAQLGRAEEARAAREAFLKIRPRFSIRDFLNRTKMKARFKGLVSDGFRKAGLPEHPPLKLPDKPSIAVLAFTNMSGDADQEYFADGITEDIITDLSKVSGLFVIARNSSFKFKGKSVDVREVGRDLGVAHVLEGSVRRAGDRLRITVQLVDAKTGGHVWAERYDRAAREIFAVQDEIAARVVAELAVTLKADEQERLVRRHTEDLAAYEIYLRARRLAGPTRNPGRRAKRRALLERVVERDPGFAPAYADLAMNLALEMRMGQSPSPKADGRRVFALARKAVAADETYPGSYVALGTAHLMRRDHDKAITAAREAVRLAPSFATGHAFLGAYLHWVGRGEEAVTAVRTAMRLEPKATSNVPLRNATFLGQAYFTARRYDDAIATFEPHRARYARRGSPGLAFLAAAHAATGRDAKARAAMKTFLAKRPRTTLSNYRGARRYKRKQDLDRYLSLLRKAGMPE